MVEEEFYEEVVYEDASEEEEDSSSLVEDDDMTAEEEGFPMVAHSFKEIGEVEAYHEKRYRKLLENVINKTVFKKDKVFKWKCRNCGYVHSGSEVPVECPVCKHAQAYFEVWCENY